MTIRGKLEKIIIDQLCISELDTKKTFEEMGVDSLDFIELGINIEEEFGIEFQDDDMNGVTSFPVLLELVEKKISAKETR